VHLVGFYYKNFTSYYKHLICYFCFISKAREIVDGVPGNDPLTVTTKKGTVTIKDVNDEAPTFNKREYRIVIPENVPDGTPLPHLDMVVHDPDIVSGHNFILTLVTNQIARCWQAICLFMINSLEQNY